MRHPHRRFDFPLDRLAAAIPLALALLASPAIAANATPPAPAAKSAASSRSGHVSAPAKAKPAAPKQTSAKAAVAASTAKSPRTLDEVHIEGELDVPEVLFITARDQRRILGFQHRRYLWGSRELASRTPLPSHLIVDHETPAPAPETPR